MKEAAGEANMTVVTILLIAIVSAVGTVVIRNMMTNTKNKSCCLDIGGEIQKGKCMVDGQQVDNPCGEESNIPDADEA